MKKIVAVSLAIASAALTIVALAAPSPRATLHGSKPSWATPHNYVGAGNPNDQLGFRVYLGWNNASAAESLALAVSNPRSSSYRHYLTPAQFRQQFAPTGSQVAQVQNWLTSQGFTLVYTPANNHYVSAQGTIRQAQAAFDVSFGRYRAPLGLTLSSPSADISIPSSLAGMVSGVIGLDESYELIHTNHVAEADHMADAPPPGGFRNAPPLSAYWAQLTSPYAYPAGFGPAGGSDPVYAPWSIQGHTPAQIKGAYGISGGCGGSCDGTGQTVAIIDAYASPTILQDANQWSTNRGIPTFGTTGGGTFTQVVSPGVYNRPNNRKQGPSGWYVEESLDVESVHGMAPNANVVFVSSPNNYQDLDAAMNHIVDFHLAQIVSNSYGFAGEVVPAGFITPLNDTLIQAAIEGIGIYFSSGDSGDETVNLGFASPDWPASSPWVTAVGGTSLGVTSGNTRAVETGWGTSTYTSGGTFITWLYGAGGGVSCIFPQPSYQSGVPGVPTGAPPGTQCEGFVGRAVPDVAALADPNTGYLMGETQSFPSTCNGPAVVEYDEFREGGTSLACPIFAGIMALSDQNAGSPHGFANPSFYQNSSEFYDVLAVETAVARRNFHNGVDSCNGTVDFLRTTNDYTGSPTQSTAAGWDNVTGLGTFNGIPQ